MSEVKPGAEFAPLDRLLEDLTGGLGLAERRRWASGIATDVRASNARRERANVEPGGDAMSPRKRRKEGKGGVRAQRMFQKASTTRFLKKIATSEGAAVGFVGATARIMRVHHYGLRDAVSERPGAPETLYTKREVLGITAQDRERILRRIMVRLAR